MHAVCACSCAGLPEREGGRLSAYKRHKALDGRRDLPWRQCQVSTVNARVLTLTLTLACTCGTASEPRGHRCHIRVQGPRPWGSRSDLPRGRGKVRPLPGACTGNQPQMPAPQGA